MHATKTAESSMPLLMHCMIFPCNICTAQRRSSQSSQCFWEPSLECRTWTAPTAKQHRNRRKAFSGVPSHRVGLEQNFVATLEVCDTFTIEHAWIQNDNTESISAPLVWFSPSTNTTIHSTTFSVHASWDVCLASWPACAYRALTRPGPKRARGTRRKSSLANAAAPN